MVDTETRRNIGIIFCFVIPIGAGILWGSWYIINVYGLIALIIAMLFVLQVIGHGYVSQTFFDDFKFIVAFMSFMLSGFIAGYLILRDFQSGVQSLVYMWIVTILARIFKRAFIDVVGVQGLRFQLSCLFSIRLLG